MLTLHILSLFIYTYLMCLYLCISDVPHGIRNKELELELEQRFSLNLTVLVIFACEILSHNNVALVNSCSSENPNNYSNLRIVYWQYSERCEVINFHMKTGSIQWRCCLFCLKKNISTSLACYSTV